MNIAPKDGRFRAIDSRVYSRERFLSTFERLSDEEKAEWFRRTEAKYERLKSLLIAAIEHDIRKLHEPR